MFQRNRSLMALLVLATLCMSLWGAPALALVQLTDRTINQAIRYGLENQGLGISTFLGGNWIEGPNGTLLNVYTPYMELARSATIRKMPSKPTDEDIQTTRKKMIEDVDYIWQHPTVKFMVSFYGPDQYFARKYFAVIEGVGRGRSFRVYPARSIPQYLADREENIQGNLYTAVNAYHFKFDDLAPMDEFTLKLYGKGVEPISFKIYNKNID